MSILAGRYVDALFGVASASGHVEPVQNDLAKIDEVLSDRLWRSRLLDPRLPAAKKKALYAKVCEGMYAHTARFLDLVLSRNRDEVLPLAFREFKKRVLASKNTVEGRVETARPIAEGEVRELAAAAGRAIGKEVRLTVIENPDLVGGVRLTVGHRMFDGSMAASLEGLRRKLLAAPVG